MQNAITFAARERTVICARASVSARTARRAIRSTAVALAQLVIPAICAMLRVPVDSGEPTATTRARCACKERAIKSPESARAETDGRAPPAISLAPVVSLSLYACMHVIRFSLSKENMVLAVFSLAIALTALATTSTDRARAISVSRERTARWRATSELTASAASRCARDSATTLTPAAIRSTVTAIASRVTADRGAMSRAHLESTVLTVP